MNATRTITWSGFVARSAPPRVPLVKLLRKWRRRAQERDQITYLDDRTLRDIGLSRLEIESGRREEF